MVSPVDARPMLIPEREALVDLLRGLDADGWRQPTECPAWTVEGIALHVLGDDLSLLSRQRDEATNGLVHYAQHHPGLGFRELLDGFNEQWVTASRFMSRQLIIDLLRLTGAQTAEFYDTIDPETPGEPVGLFAAAGPSPYWQISAREYVERFAHQQQIRRATGTPDLGEEFLATAAAVVVRSIAAHLGDSAPPDTTIGFAIPDVAAWTISSMGDNWEVTEAGEDTPTVTLKLDRSVATSALSLGLNREEIAAAYDVSGDTAFGLRLVAGIAAVTARGR